MASESRYEEDTVNEMMISIMTKYMQTRPSFESSSMNDQTPRKLMGLEAAQVNQPRPRQPSLRASISIALSATLLASGSVTSTKLSTSLACPT